MLRARRRTSTVLFTVAALYAGIGLSAAATAAEPAGPPSVVLSTLSNRADLVSDGDALMEVALAAPTTALRVLAGDRDVTSAFAASDPLHYVGVVDGLAVGPNVITARTDEGGGAQLTVVNHDVRGPIFSGPQIQPWTCIVATPDPQCAIPTTYAYFYISTDSSKSGFQPYDPAAPATDVASTKTDQNKTVPFVVRQETGSADRGIYQVAVLFDPTQPTAAARLGAWNHKMTTLGGAGCGTKHGSSLSIAVMDQKRLAKGFVVASGGLLNNGQNCNLVVQAEALMMLREHVGDAYGRVRYNIGDGCSGGAIMLQQVANAYPGLVDGLSLRCSFPDSFTGLTETYDCTILMQYWDAATARGVPWATNQKAAVAGHESESPCLNWVDVYAFNRLYDPHNKPGLLGQQNCGVPAAAAFDESTNPTGVRCALQDYMVNEFGHRASDGFANRPEDNVGVQYGLDALQAGLITVDQFVDLNANIGSNDINYLPSPKRAEADPFGLQVAYRSGAINEANNLGGVPIVDMRGHTTEDIHQDLYSFATRARLDRAFGNHVNQVYWVGPGPDPATPNGDNQFPTKGPDLIDRWLTAMEHDTRDVPLRDKLIAAKPADAVDKCYNGLGGEIQDQSLCPTLFKPTENPRQAAGDGAAYDTAKCRLESPARTDYGPLVTDAQWAQIQATFPSGVCDWGKTGVAQQGTIPWLSYADGPGGQPLGAAPQSVPSDEPGSAVPEVPYAVLLPLLGAAVLVAGARLRGAR
ncbi:MAG: hypothetical protein QOJ79_396 [Actinomycetota bacterium]|jgi:hypothetical protein|nr:hypothetical protein [Actinomycetota bacterium]